jgi:hypothetical protein
MTRRDRVLYLCLFGAVALTLSSLGAQAACRSTFDCSAIPCRQVQICDSTLDLPALPSPALPPVVMPSLRPLNPPTLAPLGTSACRQAYICNSYGQCAWRQVCQ